MKFLIDAQLPRRVAQWLQAEGHEAVHTHDLPEGNRTRDAAINELSLRERRVVITKDEDFVNLFLLRHEPYTLLLVATGNISFNDLRQLLRRLGFAERIRRDHHIFRKAGVEEKINLQREGNKAKVYQVRQVRGIILTYGLGGTE